MTRLPRIALFLLLALTQALAPWVHAHTGQETGGFLHLPGLESMARNGQEAIAPEGLTSAEDWIIGVQAGFRCDAKSPAWPCGPDAMPPPVPTVPPAPAVSEPPYPRPPPLLFRASFPLAYPRAPPPV